MRHSINALQQEKKNLNREITNLQTQIKVERTPQIDLAEKLQKQAIDHQKQITHLEEIITQTNKEKSEVAVIQPLVPLQQQLKSQTAYNASLKAEINILSQDLANFKREMKKELDNKANDHHGH